MFSLKKDWEEWCYDAASRRTSFAIKVFNKPLCYRGHWLHNPPLLRHLGFQTPLLVAIDIILVSGHLCLLLAKSSAAFWCFPVHGGEDQCLEKILQNPLIQAGETKNYGSLPMVLGGIGLRSATRTSAPAYWASWSEGTSRDAVLEAAAEDGSWSESWGSNHYSGRQRRMEPGHLSGNRRMSKRNSASRMAASSLLPSGEAFQGGALRTGICTSEGSRQVARRSRSRSGVVRCSHAQ